MTYDGYTLQDLRRAIEQCNWRKGYGSVAELHRFANGELRVRIARPHMKDTWRKGHVFSDGGDGRKAYVRFAGTTAKVRVLQHPNYN